MKKIVGLSVVVMFSTMLLVSCTKEPVNHLTQAETRIYITNHDSAVNFAAFHTFSVADSVAVIENNQLVQKDLNAFDAQFITALKTAMQQRGYTLVDKSSNPDLAINVSRIYNNYSGVVSYTDYWGDYYGYWDPYYWGYPGYNYYFPTYYGVYSISEGGLSVDMFDLKDAASNNELKYLWSGLVRGEGVFVPANIDNHVKTLFDQSVYIKTN
jgi:hypothetical protein